jgi:hypothetical protein
MNNKRKRKKKSPFRRSLLLGLMLQHQGGSTGGCAVQVLLTNLKNIWNSPVIQPEEDLAVACKCRMVICRSQHGIQLYQSQALHKTQSQPYLKTNHKPFCWVSREVLLPCSEWEELQSKQGHLEFTEASQVLFKQCWLEQSLLQQESWLELEWSLKLKCSFLKVVHEVFTAAGLP